MQNDIYISGMYIWPEESPMYVINKRISSYCDNYNIVSDAQFGFRKRKFYYRCYVCPFVTYSALFE